jgi:hypothetical protein
VTEAAVAGAHDKELERFFKLAWLPERNGIVTRVPQPAMPTNH